MVGTAIVRWIAVGVTALWLVTWSPLARALDPSLDVSKYGHTVWRSLGGPVPGVTGPMAQTADGYLWLATADGLLRFDGVRSIAWHAPPGTSLPDDRVRALLGVRDGTLWIGTYRGLASWKEGRLTTYPALDGKIVNVLEEGADGAMWVGGSDGGKGFLCAIRKTAIECEGDSGQLGSDVTGLHRDQSGALWVMNRDRIWKWGTQPTLSYSLPDVSLGFRSVIGTPDGAIVVVVRGALLKLAGGRMQTLAIGSWAKDLFFTKVLSDRDGGLWLAAADFGLLHLHEDRVDVFRAADGLSDDHVLGLFEDHEGNVWVSTLHGLDQFRSMAAATYSRSDGLLGRVSSVLVAKDGAVWAQTSRALYRLDGVHVSPVRAVGPATLFEDRRGVIWVSAPLNAFGYLENEHFVAVPAVPSGWIDAIAEDSKGNLWLAHRNAGLLRVRSDGSVERHPWETLADGSPASAMAIDPADDAVWLALRSGSVVKMLNGKVQTSIPVGDMFQHRVIARLRVGSDGALWVETRVRLARIKGGRIVTFGPGSGMPCDGVYWTLWDEHRVWLYTPCGLVDIARQEMDAWGAAADQGENAQIKVRVLDQRDGIGQPPNVGAVGIAEQVGPGVLTPKAARSSDGRIWLATGDGVVVVNPARIPANGIPPPVHVEQVVSDGKPYEARAGLRLPPLQRDLRIDYTGLSFALPDLVQFRYRLEGRDADWQDAGNRRQAFYTDLPPGRYRFSVIAANNSGLWNNKGDTLEFSIAPAWWQTDLFRAAFICAVVATLYGLHRIRVSRLSRQFTVALDARVDERLRIARELHDTLLQTFQGILLRLQTASQLWPNNDGRRILVEGINQAAEAITEGRDAVQGLRASAVESQDLADALRALGETLAASPSDREVTFFVEVEGRTRELHPLVRDDIFRIAGEALRNAFRHARPTRVEVEIHYSDRQLRLRIRDDGKGMDAGVMRLGRQGHFGLRGMRERAKLIGGKLALWSRSGAGTEVELSVPASLAYAATREVPPSDSTDEPAGHDSAATSL